MLGDVEPPVEATPQLAAALAARTHVEQPADVAAVLLAQQGHWEPANWFRRNGVWVCDGRHSYRNPDNDFALPWPQLTEISEALRQGPSRDLVTGVPR